jgi:hypothetical protein
LRQYDLLISGKGLDLNPAPVLPAVEDFVRFVENGDVVCQRMIEKRVQRARDQKILLPLNQDEVKASKARKPWINRTLSAIGSNVGIVNLKALCKENEITVGSYSFACLFFALAAAYIRRNGGEFPEQGIPTLYFDTAADLRSRLEPNPGDSFMLCIAETWLEAKIEKESTLLDIANRYSA